MREKPGSISRSVVQGFVTASELADACVASSEMALQKSACAERLAEVPKTVGIGSRGLDRVSQGTTSAPAVP